MVTFELDLFVHVQELESPSYNFLKSFNYDKTFLISENSLKTSYNNFYYEEIDSLTESLETQSDSSLTFIETVELKEDETLKRVPVFKTGVFNQNEEFMFVYSDNSAISILSEDNVGSDFSTISVGSDAHSFFVSSYQRLADGRVFPFVVWDVKNEKSELTGALDFDLNTREEILNETVLSPELLDQSFNECFYDKENEELVFNSKALFEIGTYDTETDYNVVSGLWESLGDSLPGGVYYLKHFPIVGDVFVYLYDGLNLNLLNQVPKVCFEPDTNDCFEVNRELGIIKVGAASFESQFLETAINNSVTKITLLNDLENIIPNSGIIQIDSEKIKYRSREGSTLLLCERGYDGTTPASHTAETEVFFLDHGAVPPGTLFCSYRVGPRVDYEVTTSNKRTANSNSWLDLTGAESLQSTGVIHLRTHTGQATKVLLTAEAPLISTNYYGPVQYGSYPVILTATALNAADIPIDNIKITISVDSGYGFVNSSDYYSARSNQNGEIKAIFTAPFKENKIESICSYSETGGVTTLSSADIVGNEDSSDFIIFQIIKSDPVVASKGILITAKTEPGPSLGNKGKHGEYFIDIEGFYDSDSLIDSEFWAIDSGNTYYSRTIKYAENINMSPPVTRIYFETEINTGLETLTGETVVLYNRTGTVFDDETLNGTRVLLYKQNLSNEYERVTADSVSVGEITIEDILPEPSPTDTSKDIAAYSIYVPKVTRLIAEINDLDTGSFAVSDPLYLQLVLPNYMQSLVNGSIQPWTLNASVSSGIGGTNFLTLNPKTIVTPRISIQSS